MIGLLLRFIPFVGPLSILFSFGRRVLHLKQEKIAHQAVGEPFPVSNQAEIDNHAVRIQIAGWRLAAGVMTATTLGTGFLWYGATLKIEEVTVQLNETERMRALAVQRRDEYYVKYTESERELGKLRIRISEESIKRQGVIVAETKQKAIIRRKKIEAERKMAVTEPVNPADILRIESAGGSEFTPASAIVSDASGLQAREGDGTAP